MVPHLTRFEPLRVMAIFATYLRAGRSAEPVWFRGPKTSPKVPAIYGATSGGPNSKLMLTLKNACPPRPYTLGAGPKPVCHQITGANFTWRKRYFRVITNFKYWRKIRKWPRDAHAHIWAKFYLENRRT